MQSDGGNRKAQEVREMFGAIARRYDLLNHLLSGNIDRYWRRACVRGVVEALPPGVSRVLDVGCGTGDLSLGFAERAEVTACDFCLPMLRLAGEKTGRSGHGCRIALLAADALALPFAEASFDAVVSAFVLRNLADPQAGLLEMRRVLRRGGVVGVLDFSLPTIPIAASIYRFYFTRILPRIGRWVSGVNGAYSYLPDSVASFPPPAQLARGLQEAGFGRVEAKLLTGGVAALLVGVAE